MYLHVPQVDGGRHCYPTILRKRGKKYAIGRYTVSECESGCSFIREHQPKVNIDCLQNMHGCCALMQPKMRSWLFLCPQDYLTMKFSNFIFAGIASSTAVAHAAPPTVTTLNGTYSGLCSAEYGVESFLGLPYAQPPVGSLRYRIAQPVNATWNGTKPATEFGNQCVGCGVSAPGGLVHFRHMIAHHDSRAMHT